MGSMQNGEGHAEPTTKHGRLDCGVSSQWDTATVTSGVGDARTLETSRFEALERSSYER